MSVDILIAKLQRVKKSRKPGNLIACCPAHKDKNPSMSIAELDNGRIVVHCFAGCSIEEILASVGLSFGDLFPQSAPRAEGYRPERRPFNAHDVLECLANEALIASVASSNLRTGMTLTSDDHERLWLASTRLEEGRRLANGER